MLNFSDSLRMLTEGIIEEVLKEIGKDTSSEKIIFVRFVTILIVGVQIVDMIAKAHTAKVYLDPRLVHIGALASIAKSYAMLTEVEEHRSSYIELENGTRVKCKCSSCKVVRNFLQKYGEEIKEQMGDLQDETIKLLWDRLGRSN